MNSFWGVDTAQLRGHAERLRTASDEVEDLTARLGAMVQGTPWTGSDAEAFRARWTELAASQLEEVCGELLALGGDVLDEADQQDVASRADGASADPDVSAIQPAEASETSVGYLQEDHPWIPNWLENPIEDAASGLAGMVSDGIGRSFTTGMGVLEGGLDRLGVNMDGFAQFQRDAGHFGEILEDWATGERVPTIAEVSAAGLLALGSAGVGFHEAATGHDSPFLDDRPGGIVESVSTDSTPAQSPRTLQDLVMQNDALRIDNPGGPLENGQIGVQEVRSVDGADPAFIIQVPPTEGASPTDVPGAYGEQGSSRDWGSNIRMVAGQHPAAMDDVRAAMDAAGVPPGAEVMIVGHSQGGIVANHLSADPTFNSASGEPGTYNVTHTFSVGSPVQTVIPSQLSTQSVNVNHENTIGPGGSSGDLIAALDLNGVQIDGGILEAPNRHEVSLPGYPVPSLHPVTVLESNHDSTSPDGGADGGYSGSVGRATATDPTLAALQEDLTGVYLGDGTYVAQTQVVTVGRGEL
ncbi:MAG: WXG100 family type VII secretion target [Brachybacterium sp.]